MTKMTKQLKELPDEELIKVLRYPISFVSDDNRTLMISEALARILERGVQPRANIVERDEGDEPNEQ